MSLSGKPNTGTPVGVNGVTKRYGSRTILNNIDLHIPSGQFVAVAGRSGCGKSTLLRLLTGLEQTTQDKLLAVNAPAADGARRYPSDVPRRPSAAVEAGDRQHRSRFKKP